MQQPKFFLVDVSQGGGVVRKKCQNDVVHENTDECVILFETLVILNLICEEQIALLLSFLYPEYAISRVHFFGNPVSVLYTYPIPPQSPTSHPQPPKLFFCWSKQAKNIKQI